MQVFLVVFSRPFRVECILVCHHIVLELNSIDQYRLHPIFINNTNCSPAHPLFLCIKHITPHRVHTFKEQINTGSYLFILHSTCKKEKTSLAHTTSTYSVFPRKLKSHSMRSHFGWIRFSLLFFQLITTTIKWNWATFFLTLSGITRGICVSFFGFSFLFQRLQLLTIC